MKFGLCIARLLALIALAGFPLPQLRSGPVATFDIHNETDLYRVLNRLGNQPALSGPPRRIVLHTNMLIGGNELEVRSDMEIDAQGFEIRRVAGTGRLIFVKGGALTLRNAVLKNGRVVGDPGVGGAGGGGGLGGAIFVNEGAKLIAEDCIFEENQAEGGLAHCGDCATPSSPLRDGGPDLKERMAAAAREFFGPPIPGENGRMRADNHAEDGQRGRNGTPGLNGSDGSSGSLFTKGGDGGYGSLGGSGSNGGHGGDGQENGASVTAGYLLNSNIADGVSAFSGGNGGAGGNGGHGGAAGRGGQGGFGGGGGIGGLGGDGGDSGVGGDSGIDTKESLDRAARLPGVSGNSGNGGRGGDGGRGGFGAGGGASGIGGIAGRRPIDQTIRLQGATRSLNQGVLQRLIPANSFSLDLGEGDCVRALINTVPLADVNFWLENNVLSCDEFLFGSRRKPFPPAGIMGVNGVNGAGGQGGFGGSSGDNTDFSHPNQGYGRIGGAGAGMGGALFIHPDGEAVVRRSLFRNNSVLGGLAPVLPPTDPDFNSPFYAEGRGANRGKGLGSAIFNLGALRLEHCTLTENMAQDGAAIFNFRGEYDPAGHLSSSGSVEIRYCTIVGNTTQNGASAGLGDQGGGIAMTRTILTGNYRNATTADAPGVAYSETVGSETGNNLVSVDAKLGPLASNGGRIPTFLPRLGSPALNAVNGGPDVSSETDQRGFPRLSGNLPDIGAVEADGKIGVSQIALEDAIMQTPENGTLSLDLWNGQTVSIRNLHLSKSITIDASGAAQGVIFDGSVTNQIVTISGSGAQVIFKKVRFQRGASVEGGGLRVENQASVILDGCVVSDCQAILGGGLYVEDGSASIVNTTFINNRGTHSGGAIYAGEFASAAPNVSLMQATFTGNSPNALHVLSSTEVQQCTFHNNGAVGILADGPAGAHVSLTGTIISGASSATVQSLNGAEIDADAGYNMFSDHPPGLGAIPGNQFNSDPQFLPLDMLSGFTPVLPLALSSPARDAGSPAAALSDSDQLGSPRVLDREMSSDGVAVIDIGAVEAQNRVLHVRAGAPGAGTGSTWAAALPTLDHAFLMVVPGDEIRVARGVYQPHRLDGVLEGGRIPPGVTLIGGYAGSEGWFDAPNPETNLTVVSGDVDENDLGAVDGIITDSLNIRGRNTQNVLRIEGGIGRTNIVEGFTITAGKADGADDKQAGGGIFYSGGGALIVRNVKFTGNAASVGGGAYVDISSGGSALFEDTRFEANRDLAGAVTFGPGARGGAGLYVKGAARLNRTTFISNVSGGIGGGAWLEDGPQTLAHDRVAFLENSAQDGGGLAAFGGWANFRNSIFSRNSAAGNGGGVFSDDANARFIHCTFSRNTSDSATAAGGWQMGYNSPHRLPVTKLAEIHNCIFWNNSSGRARLAEQQFYTEKESFSSSCSIFQGDDGQPPVQWSVALDNVVFGAHPFDHDPAFYEDQTGFGFGGRHDLRLLSGIGESPRSAAIDAAPPSNAFGLAVDYDGNPRVVRATAGNPFILDLGAFENPGGPRFTTVLAEPRANNQSMSWAIGFTEPPLGLGPEDFMAIAADGSPVDIAPGLVTVEPINAGQTAWRVSFSDFNKAGSIYLALAWNTLAVDSDGNNLTAAGYLDPVARAFDPLPEISIGPPSRLASNGQAISFPLTLRHVTALAGNPAGKLQITKTGDLSADAVVTGTLPNLLATFSNFSGGGTLKFAIGSGLATDSAGRPSPATGYSTEVVVSVNPAIFVSAPMPARTARGPIRFRLNYNRGGTVLPELSDVILHTTGSAWARVTLEKAPDGAPLVLLKDVRGTGSLGISVKGRSGADPAGAQYPDSAVSALATIVAPVAERLYVNTAAGGLNSGASWENAFTRLDDALAISGTNEIWIAGGVHKPANLAGEREATFFVPPGVTLRGGFAGNEISADSRSTNHTTNPTILSGDLAGDDDSAINTNPLSPTLANNARAVLTLEGGAAMSVIDRVVITGGNADGPAGSGGGASVISGLAAFRDTRLVGNRAQASGGGLFADRAAVLLENCVVEQNFSAAQGGGLAAVGSAIELRRTSLLANSASGNGGALSISGGSGLLLHSRAQGNSAGRQGGALFVESSLVSARNTLIAGNAALPSPGEFAHGGGVHLGAGGTFIGQFTTIEANRASGNGGAFFVADHASLRLENSIMYDNQGSFIVYVEPSADSVMLRRCLTSAALALFPRIALVEPIFYTGGAIFSGTIAPADAPSLQGDFTLSANAAAVDAGDDANVMEGETDLAGQPRRFDGNLDGVARVDLGAFERHSQEPPSAPELHGRIISEDEPAGSLAGYFASYDINGGPIAFAFADGEGAGDNAKFAISGTNLLTAAVFDFEATPELFIRVRATDTSGLFREAAFVIQVRNLSEAPPVAYDDYPAAFAGGFDHVANVLDGSVSSLDADADPDGDPISVVAVNGNPSLVGSPFALASGATVILTADGRLTYNAGRAFEELKSSDPAPVETLTYTISDGTGGFATASIYIRVRPVNDAPRVQNDSGVRLPGRAMKIHRSSLLANDYDPDGDVMTVSLSENGPPEGRADKTFSALGAAVIVLGEYLIYQPDPDGILGGDPGGEDSFIYYARDTRGRQSEGTVTLTPRDPEILFFEFAAPPSVVYNTPTGQTEVRATLLAPPSRVFRIEAASTLDSSAAWISAGRYAADSLGRIELTETISGHVTQRFYRSRLE